MGLSRLRLLVVEAPCCRPELDMGLSRLWLLVAVDDWCCLAEASASALEEDILELLPVCLCSLSFLLLLLRCLSSDREEDNLEELLWILFSSSCLRLLAL